MTILQLRNEVRRITPPEFTTCVSAELWDHAHGRISSFCPHVKIHITGGGRTCESVEARTIASALVQYRDDLLPRWLNSEQDAARGNALELDCQIPETVPA